MLRPPGEEENQNTVASQFRNSMFDNFQKTLVKQTIEKAAGGGQENLGKSLLSSSENKESKAPAKKEDTKAAPKKDDSKK